MAPVPSWHELQFRPDYAAFGGRVVKPNGGCSSIGVSLTAAIAPTGTIISSACPSSRHGAERHEAVARLLVDRDEPVHGAVAELDLDCRLPVRALLREPLDVRC